LVGFSSGFCYTAGLVVVMSIMANPKNSAGTNFGHSELHGSSTCCNFSLHANDDLLHSAVAVRSLCWLFLGVLLLQITFFLFVFLPSIAKASWTN
jgi:hypothetical protein